MTARCTAPGCGRRCRRDATRCTDHQLANLNNVKVAPATVPEFLEKPNPGQAEPLADDPADVGRALIRNALTDVTAGRIPADEARHVINLALPLVTGR